MTNLAIIGGGAAGMAAAISAAHKKNELSITIYERMDRVGKKLLATGNGRCNYTNLNTSVKNYHGRQPDFVLPALTEYGVSDTVNFFNTLGVFPREEDKGKLYPFSGQASAVLDALRAELARCGVNIVKANIKNIKKTQKGFALTDSEGGCFYPDRVIMAAGGCASPSLGSDGSGFELLKQLGHRITPLSPALVQLKTPTDEIKALKGIKIWGMLTMLSGDEVLSSDEGEILFTDYGISGPPVFQLSTLAPRYKHLTASVDFMSEYSQGQIYDILENRRSRLSHLTAESFFIGLLNKRLGNIILRRAGIAKLSLPIGKIGKGELWQMTAQIKDFRLPIIGTNGFANAQVTAGGVLTSEFNAETMESKLCGGLYCAGEIYDIYGDCGGYNLQWAWSSGRLAGKNAVED